MDAPGRNAGGRTGTIGGNDQEAGRGALRPRARRNGANPCGYAEASPFEDDGDEGERDEEERDEDGE